MDENEGRIDFTPLDPSRDGERWEARVQQIAARAARAHQERQAAAPGGWSALLGWWRPALSFAVVLALAIWAGVLARGHAPPAARGRDPALTVLEWSLSGETPGVGEVLDVAGGRDGD